MRHLLTILAALLLCSAPLHAQTLKSLMYNATNAQVVANTGTNVLTFTNAVRVTEGTDRIEISPYGVNGWDDNVSLEENFLAGNSITVFSWNVDSTNSAEFTLAVPLNFNANVITNIVATSRANLGFSTNLNTLWTATNASAARSAVGIPLPALTNTSNVTMMRALAGSTNTNEPHSGVIELTDGTTSYELTFSNGVLLKIISGL